MLVRTLTPTTSPAPVLAVSTLLSADAANLRAQILPVFTMQRPLLVLMAERDELPPRLRAAIGELVAAIDAWKDAPV